MTATGFSRLVGAVLIRALQDLGEEEYRPEVQAFLGSELFEEMAAVVGLDPHMIRATATAGRIDISSVRAAYR